MDSQTCTSLLPEQQTKPTIPQLARSVELCQYFGMIELQDCESRKPVLTSSQAFDTLLPWIVLDASVEPSQEDERMLEIFMARAD